MASPPTPSARRVWPHPSRFTPSTLRDPTPRRRRWRLRRVRPFGRPDGEPLVGAPLCIVRRAAAGRLRAKRLAGLGVRGLEVRSRDRNKYAPGGPRAAVAAGGVPGGLAARSFCKAGAAALFDGAGCRFRVGRRHGGAVGRAAAAAASRARLARRGRGAFWAGGGCAWGLRLRGIAGGDGRDGVAEAGSGVRIRGRLDCPY